jgi:hypothetical protein
LRPDSSRALVTKQVEIEFFRKLESPSFILLHLRPDSSRALVTKQVEIEFSRKL